MTANKELQKAELSMSARFMNHVVQEYGSGVGEVALTNFQKRLAQNYFMAVDDALAKQEQKLLDEFATFRHFHRQSEETE